jgi:spoIIIJ-associated protein
MSTSNTKDILEKILSEMGIQAQIAEHQLEEGALLDVQTEDSTRLIGRRGQTLSALQYLVNRISFVQSKDSPKVTVDVANYRTQAREALIEKAKAAAEKVRRWGDIVELSPMNAFDRRIVHHALQEVDGVETKSVEIEASEMKAILLKPAH